LTLEDVVNIYEREQADAVVVNLAARLLSISPRPSPPTAAG
jgi:hypothetical protein